MLVSSIQRQIVLEHQRRDPEVVGWNRGALHPELAIDGRVVVGGLIVGEQHTNPRPHLEAAERSFVGPATTLPLTSYRIMMTGSNVGQSLTTGSTDIVAQHVVTLP